jgi:hypothetical protein
VLLGSSSRQILSSKSALIRMSVLSSSLKSSRQSRRQKSPPTQIKRAATPLHAPGHVGSLSPSVASPGRGPSGCRRDAWLTLHGSRQGAMEHWLGNEPLLAHDTVQTSPVGAVYCNYLANGVRTQGPANPSIRKDSLSFSCPEYVGKCWQK